jgi:hypothetical protein
MNAPRPDAAAALRQLQAQAAANRYALLKREADARLIRRVLSSP